MKYDFTTTEEDQADQGGRGARRGRGGRRAQQYAQIGRGHQHGRDSGPGGRGRGRGEGWGAEGAGSGRRGQHGPWGEGRPGGSFGPGGPGGPGGPRGRRGGGRGRRGDVRRAILALLAEGPANGYQIMSGIEEKSHGLWRPSPGSVYPALSMLEDEGLIEAVTQDGRKSYQLTDSGRAQVAESGENEKPWDEVAGPRSGWLDVRAQAEALLMTVQTVAGTGTAEQRAQAGEVLDRARRDLHRIMAGDDVSGQ